MWGRNLVSTFNKLYILNPDIPSKSNLNDIGINPWEGLPLVELTVLAASWCSTQLW